MVTVATSAKSPAAFPSASRCSTEGRPVNSSYMATHTARSWRSQPPLVQGGR